MIILLACALLFLWPMYVFVEVTEYDQVTTTRSIPRDFYDDYDDESDLCEDLLCNVRKYVSSLGSQFLSLDKF